MIDKVNLRQKSLSNIKLDRFLEEITAKNISYIAMDIFMIAAPLITYLFQICKFYQTKSSKGFSKLICLFLFLGNIFRIFFWYGIKFKKALLFQSIGIILFQIILIHLCLKFKEDPSNNSNKSLPEVKLTTDNNLNIENKNNINLVKNYIVAYFKKTFKPKYFKWMICSKTFNPKLFWNWTEENEYYKFMVVVAGLLYLICSNFKTNQYIFQMIGIIGAFFESVICFPQIIKNYKTKFTKNISFLMIFCWFFGDSFRLFYNIQFRAPIQLISGISAQIFFDFIILIQLIRYRKNISIENDKVNQNKKQIEEINQLMKSIDELNLGK